MLRLELNATFEIQPCSFLGSATPRLSWIFPRALLVGAPLECGGAARLRNAPLRFRGLELSYAFPESN